MCQEAIRKTSNIRIATFRPVIQLGVFHYMSALGKLSDYAAIIFIHENDLARLRFPSA